MDNGDRIDAIVVNFSKAFDLFPRDRQLVITVNFGVDSSVIA